VSVAEVGAAVSSALAPPRRASARSWGQRGLFAVGIVGLILLWTSLPHADWPAVLRQVGPALPVMAAIALAWTAFYARGLRVILDGAVGWGRLVYNRFVGDAFNVVMPIGDIGGDPLRVMDLGRLVGTAKAVRAIVFDRLVYVTGGLVFSALGSAAAVRTYAWDARLERLLTGYVVVALIGSAGLFLLATKTAAVRTVGRILRFVKVHLPELPEPLPARAFARALAWNLLARAGVLAELTVLLLALGQHPTFASVVAISAIVSVAGIVFTFIPGGIGVNEGAAVLALTLTGYGEAVGLTIGLARRVRQLLLAAAGVAVSAARSAAERRRS
jgi:uncharacterized membrane protein YbhN (UPF0104 family)